MNKPYSVSSLCILFCKGLAMGAADVVPGVSGGTIAFISGIYDRLLAAISACTPNKLVWLCKGRWRETWTSIDGTFLLVLLSGILTSIASLAQLISYLLEARPEMIWSFFFGLIVVSIWLVGQQIGRWNASSIAALIGGAVAMAGYADHGVFGRLHRDMRNDFAGYLRQFHSFATWFVYHRAWRSEKL